MEPIKTNSQKRASTLTINGRVLDAASGHQVGGSSRPKTRQYGSFDIKPATSVHAAPARSQTLRRTGLEKPQPARPLASRHVRSISPVVTHPDVSRFGRPAEATVNDAHFVQPSEVLSAVNAADSAEQPIALATQVQNYAPAVKAAPAQIHTSSVSKKVAEHQIKHAPTRAEQTTHAKKHAVKRGPVKLSTAWKKVAKRLHIRITAPVVIIGTILVVIGASVICYLTVPALSLFVAARSAGVEATYPGYVPSGYHFKGPVTYSEGKVSMSFASAGSGSTYTIEQSATFWDSGAVLDNYVLTRSQNYLTYSEGGITVYTFGSQAAWVNAGVLHTIDGNAQLTSDQILRIAGSM